MREKITVSTLLAVAALFLLALPFMIGCDIKQDSQTQVSVSVAIRTITHDGHKFVMADHGRGVSILHHPDCPCQKK